MVAGGAPQVVRLSDLPLTHLLWLPDGSLVCDPMCGKGSILLEALDAHPTCVAVGLDVKISGDDYRLRGRGWETDGGDLWTVLERLDSEGCSRFVVTDVTKDGTLNGPNLDLLAAVCERTDAPVIASGGVSSLDDLRAIATLTDRGVEGAIVGKALYAERFTLPEALAAVRS